VRTWRRPDDPEDVSIILPTVIESGPTWPLTDQERDDLDLYSQPVGIFGLLNRTSTQQGARRLRDMLDGPCISREFITRRQEAVRWLAEHETQCIDIMASALPMRSQSERLDVLIKRLHETTSNPHPTASKWIRTFSAFSGLAFLYGLFQIFSARYIWIDLLILLAVFNGLVTFFHRAMLAQLRESVLPLVELARALRAVHGVARCARENLPDETQLKVLKDHLDAVATRGEIPSLCDKLAWMALGGPVRGLLNLVVFYDLHVAEAILARFVPNRNILLEGLAAFVEFEALAGLACYSAARPVRCYPQVASDTQLSIAGGVHPLIAAEDAQANDVHLTNTERMWVVTGPNAAGKSTYLRMVGVNLLLAHIGAAVPARQMAFAPVRLLTDVRIRDDLAKHESYFLSEVRRLRRMIADTQTDPPLLGLIDEPFRGTNSSERTAAGVALVEHLLASDHLFLVATHEETLAQTAAASDSAANYHFQEHLTEGGIVFDYLLRPGPAGTKTAIRILEQEKYPQRLLDRARDLMRP
jgi:DNA mismatch repair ATPase MutS